MDFAKIRVYMYKTIIFSLFLSLFAFVSCDLPTPPEHSRVPVTGNTYFRLLTPSGTNVLDSLAAASLDINAANFDVKIQRMSDGKSILPIVEICQKKFGSSAERQLIVSWLDFDLYDQFTRQNGYKIQLQSARFFGDQTHTVEWFVHFNPSCFYPDAYLCLLDGHEVVEIEDPYQLDPPPSESRKMFATVTITCPF